MKQSKYIFLVALFSVVFANSAYSQKNWEMREYPTYRWHEEWIFAANGGFTASDYIHWGAGVNVGKKINPYWTVRTEAYLHSVLNDDYDLGPMAMVGAGINFSISETFSGYSRNRIFDLYATPCVGVLMGKNNDFLGSFGYYVNFGLGAYTRIAENVYFNVEDKVFCMTNFNNAAFYNYLSIGIVLRIHSNTRPGW